jgi:2-phosphosulfolactate phosphatase
MAAEYMAYFDQATFDVRFEWGIAGLKQLAPADAIVIIDVLSFSTSVDIAVTRGAAVLPYPWKDESAKEYAQKHSAQLAGCRGGEGFSLGPSSLLKATEGLRLVLPSQNGSSLAFEARSIAPIVIAGCLRNASAIAAWANQSKRTITVIACGERWPDNSLRPAMEDLIGAGAIIKELNGRWSPESIAAVAAFDAAKDSLCDHLMQCTSGRELIEKGYAADVELAADLDVSPIVPILNGDAFVARR